MLKLPASASLAAAITLTAGAASGAIIGVDYNASYPSSDLIIGKNDTSTGNTQGTNGSRNNGPLFTLSQSATVTKIYLYLGTRAASTNYTFNFFAISSLPASTGQNYTAGTSYESAALTTPADLSGNGWIAWDITDVTLPAGIYGVGINSATGIGSLTYNGDSDENAGYIRSGQYYSAKEVGFAIQAVPEPASLSLMALGGLTLRRWRRV